MRFGPIALLLTALPGWGAIEGVVELDDSLPFASPAEVSLVCEGEELASVQSDLAGRFRLNAPDESGSCELHARLRGYHEAAVRVRALPLDPRIPALTLARRGLYQGASVSATTLGAPREAVAAYRRAMAASTMIQAEAALGEALQVDPQLAEAWFQLGRVRLALNDGAAAQEAFERAVGADPWFVSPYRPLLMLSVAEQRWATVASLCEQLVEMNPYLADAHYYAGLAAIERGSLEDARQSLRAIENGPEAGRFPRQRHLRGLLFEAEGRTREATTEYQAYLAEDSEGDAAASVKARLQALRAGQ